MRVYVPNVKSAVQRRAHAVEKLTAAGFSDIIIHKARYWKDYASFKEMVEAADGWGHKVLKKRYDSNPVDHIVLGDLACCWTFLEIHQQIAESGEPGVFMVDDVYPLKSHAEIQQLSDDLGDYQIMQFWCWDLEFKDAQPLEGYPGLFLGIGGEGDDALMLTPDGAELLLHWALERPGSVLEFVLRMNAGAHKRCYFQKWTDADEDRWFRASHLVDTEVSRKAEWNFNENKVF